MSPALKQFLWNAEPDKWLLLQQDNEKVAKGGQRRQETVLSPPSTIGEMAKREFLLDC
jgi:hypothetical protein